MRHTQSVVPGVLASCLAAVGIMFFSAAPAAAQVKDDPPNLRVAIVLSLLDIDGDGVPDNSPDSDHDGLPDNWETGGSEPASKLFAPPPDRFVLYSAPTAIGPGTPPTFVVARQLVSTRADMWDTDGDGLSDFVEVFGLKYIDENGNGVLDADEWDDINGDGLPSVGESPLLNLSPGAPLFRDHDFDGFVFTDPTNPDTDGDGELDGVDRDPLINPQTFNVTGLTFTRSGAPANDKDLDNDGLGNGSDFGNDNIGQVDFPVDLDRLLQLYRFDLFQLRVVPEALLEDLVGADWDGNGLFRVTDVRDWTPVTDRLESQADFPEFHLQGRNLFASQLFADVAAAYNAEVTADNPRYGRRGVGLGYQLLLRPSGPADWRTSLIPDVHIWAILYAWRVPGFDIDGNGFTGIPSAAKGTTAARSDSSGFADVALRDGQVVQDVRFDEVSSGNAGITAFDDRIGIADLFSPSLDGQIDVPRSLCGNLGAGMTMTMGLAPLAMVLSVSARRRRRASRCASDESRRR